jgi:transposase
MGNPAGVRRNFEELEKRRMEAGRLLEQGVSQSEVARRLGVHRQSVIRWTRQIKRSGMRGLRKVGRAGRKPQLSTADRARAPTRDPRRWDIRLDYGPRAGCAN